eukprot:4827225-Pleurochrysis_carterae.AAC.3
MVRRKVRGSGDGRWRTRKQRTARRFKMRAGCFRQSAVQTRSTLKQSPSFESPRIVAAEFAPSLNTPRAVNFRRAIGRACAGGARLARAGERIERLLRVGIVSHARMQLPACMAGARA